MRGNKEVGNVGGGAWGTDLQRNSHESSDSRGLWFLIPGKNHGENTIGRKHHRGDRETEKSTLTPTPSEILIKLAGKEGYKSAGVSWGKKEISRVHTKENADLLSKTQQRKKELT